FVRYYTISIMKLSTSLLEKLDPRTKIISFLSVILCMILTPITHIREFGLYFLLILAIGFCSKITPRQILKKVCILIPFVLFIAMFVPFVKEGNVCWSLKISNWKFDITYEGVWTFLNIIVKSTLSVFLLVIASSTTTFPDFLKGLDMLRIPRLLVMLMSFMYRYIFVLIDEAGRLMRARSLRYFGSGYKEQFRVIGYMIGVLFIRTFERAERIFNAMIIRGFSGEVISVKRFGFSYMDILFMADIIVSLVCIVSGLINKIEHIRVSGAHLWQGL
ncbi:MAG: cobalt ECF transporter T component CbiQ, partial [Candidatus Brocadiales bacterium]|nr:cobalt ECF transporter T component CbiQ [Candidatus Brocadiales bacterium]